MQRKTLNKQRPCIGIDLLGCETPPEEILEAIVSFHSKEKRPPSFILFGPETLLKKIPASDDFVYSVAKEEIKMDEDPLISIRRKKESSIALGIESLKNLEIDAFISAGNTGALLASAKLRLPMIAGIQRPALMTLIPSKNDPIAVLDVGANVGVKAENLFQFAQMGIAYQKTRGIKFPTVGLLNIGEEKHKGTPELRKAYNLLNSLNKKTPPDHPTFIGNIEGRDVFSGAIDVLITDGFIGNVFLKTSEGIAGFVLEQMQNLGPIEAIPGIKSILAPLKQRLHYAEYPGALFCGLDRIIMKCHGESPPEAFINSIRGASSLVKNSFLTKIKTQLR